MPWVTITGDLWDHSQVRLPADRQPELYFRPNDAAIGGGVLIGVDVKASLDVPTGAFSIVVYSDLTDRIKYRPWVRWLSRPGDIESYSWQYKELPFEIVPDTGGSIGGLLEQQFGIGLVYVAENAPASDRRNQLQLNPKTGWLYERIVQW